MFMFLFPMCSTIFTFFPSLFPWCSPFSHFFHHFSHGFHHFPLFSITFPMVFTIFLFFPITFFPWFSPFFHCKPGLFPAFATEARQERAHHLVPPHLGGHQDGGGATVVALVGVHLVAAAGVITWIIIINNYR